MEPFQVEDPRDIARDKNLTWIQKNFQGAFASIFITGLVLGLVIGLFCLGGGGASHSGRTGDKIALVAHRGAMDQAPENTLEAINLAFNQGADGVSFELRKSHDGQFFLNKDDTLQRRATKECPDELCGDAHKSSKKLEQDKYEEEIAKNVEDLNYADFIKYVNVAADPDDKFDPAKTGLSGRTTKAHPPTLHDVMIPVLSRGRVAYCEIKMKEDGETLGLLAKLVKERAYNHHQLFFSSFDADVLKALKELLPTFNMMLLVCTRWGLGGNMPRVISADGTAEDYCGGDTKDALKKVTDNELDGLGIDAWLGHSVTQELGDLIAANKKEKKKPDELLAWSWPKVIPDKLGGDSVQNIKAMEILGVHSFQSDFPKGVREWMAHGRSCDHEH